MLILFSRSLEYLKYLNTQVVEYRHKISMASVCGSLIPLENKDCI